MKKLLIGLLILMMLIGCNNVIPDPPDPPETDIVYRGFFVGVSDYIYSTGMDLMSPAMNTYKLEDLFKDARFGEEDTEFSSITRLINHQATKENILDGILEEFGDADEDDISYFYFMGHGTNEFPDYPSILPADFNFTFSKYLTVHELEEALSQIQGTKIVLLETCHAGSFIEKSRSNFNQEVINIFSSSSLDTINKDGYQVLCSSAGDEYSYDSSGGSLFCKMLIQGCESLNADDNDDGVINLTELHEYTVNHVAIQTAQLYPEGSDFVVYEE